MAYSRALVKGGWCFVSGVTGYDYRTMIMPQDVAEQMRNCFLTIGQVLEQAGFGFDDIVRIRYVITDESHVEAIAPVLVSVLGEIRPAATMIIAGLIRPEMKVEVDVTALRG